MVTITLPPGTILRQGDMAVVSMMTMVVEIPVPTIAEVDFREDLDEAEESTGDEVKSTDSSTEETSRETTSRD